MPFGQKDANSAALPSQPHSLRLLKTFFAKGRGTLRTHLKQWWTSNVAFGFGCEPAFARVLARVVLGMEVAPLSVDSAAHGMGVDVAELAVFLNKDRVELIAGYQESFVAQEHAGAVAELADAPAEAPIDLEAAAEADWVDQESNSALSAAVVALALAVEDRIQLPVHYPAYRGGGA
jgi:hypothetical protein